jgi:hypothetical protein
MGDRGNIIVRDSRPGQEDDPKLYLYSHWGGYRLPLTVRRTLSRKARWGDGPYLSRMLFVQMIRDGIGADATDAAVLKEFASETGYGISPAIGDNEHLLVVVDIGRQEVRYTVDEEGTEPVETWSFADFIDPATDIATPYGENPGAYEE